MDIGMEVDQFELLEEKIDRLIGSIQSLKRENETLNEKLQIQEEKLADMNEQVENLRASRDNAKARIVSLLDKIEQIGL
ncbi:cell division protein ZapB [Desulfatiglans anilini]|uniref:cell division protein ZapB n=1 Tax=Desulfatiglans anilini TaxID=90728 RepID=UPI000412734D|nr:cell division protein ZapB [Desulfatiglans anilini]